MILATGAQVGDARRLPDAAPDAYCEGQVLHGEQRAAGARGPRVGPRHHRAALHAGYVYSCNCLRVCARPAGHRRAARAPLRHTLSPRRPLGPPDAPAHRLPQPC